MGYLSKAMTHLRRTSIYVLEVSVRDKTLRSDIDMISHIQREKTLVLSQTERSRISPPTIVTRKGET